MQIVDIDDKGDENKNLEAALGSMALGFSTRGARGATTAMFTQFISFFIADSLVLPAICNLRCEIDATSSWCVSLFLVRFFVLSMCALF